MLKSSSSSLHHHHHHNHFSSGASYGHSPRDLLTGAAVTAVPTSTTTSPPMPVNLDVQRIDNTTASTVVMIKLTDEMFAALEAGQRSGKKLRIHVDEKEGRVEIGDGTASSKTNNTFYFQKQSLPDQTDTLVQAGGVVRNVGTYKTKYQIQATDRSFEETKKRAEMRAEVEKSRGTKEMKKDGPSSSSSSSNAGGSSSSRRLNPSSSSSSSTPRTLTSTSSSRVSPSSFVSSSAAKASTSKSKTSSSSSSAKTDMLKPELLRQPLRKRVVHLVVTQKYKSWEEVYKKMQTDGMPADAEQDECAEKVRLCVDDVAEARAGAGGVLSLRTSLLSEVDARWMFFNQDEKAHVRRLQTAQSGSRAAPSDAASNFAPMRKKGMERMTASKEKRAATPPVPAVTAPAAPTSTCAPTKETRIETDDDDYYVAPEPRRRAHNLAPPAVAPVAATTVVHSDGPTPPKRAKRNESASPPEDPPQQETTAKLSASKLTSMVAMQPLPKFEQPRESHTNTTTTTTATVAANGGGSTASSRISSPASSLSSPSQPSCNWEKQFGDIKSLNEAEQYFKLFHKDYPVYMECHRKLTEVSAEFRQLESRLARASEQRKSVPSSVTIQQVRMVEKQIQERYAFFEKDYEFLRARQRHTDLRSKLNVLKSRIGKWETHRRLSAV